MKGGIEERLNRALESIEAFLEKTIGTKPKIAVVLGSGLSSFTNRVLSFSALRYGEIPGFPDSTVSGHQGKLVVGYVGEVPVLVWAGRAHYYEGRSLEDVTFYVRLTRRVGINTLFLSNAAGALTTEFSPGDLMVIQDHINMMGVNPLRGPAYRFVDLTNAYNKEYQDILMEEAARLGISLKRGVYVATMGPSYETPAEVRSYAMMGGSAVGMSTVPEVIVAAAEGLKVAAVSCITNLAAGLSSQPLSHEEVKLTAGKVEKAFGDLVEAFILRIGKEG